MIGAASRRRTSVSGGRDRRHRRGRGRPATALLLDHPPARHDRRRQRRARVPGGCRHPERPHRAHRRPFGRAGAGRDRCLGAVRRARVHQHPQPRRTRRARHRREHADAGRDHRDSEPGWCRRDRSAPAVERGGEGRARRQHRRLHRLQQRLVRSRRRREPPADRRRDRADARLRHERARRRRMGRLRRPRLQAGLLRGDRGSRARRRRRGAVAHELPESRPADAGGQFQLARRGRRDDRDRREGRAGAGRHAHEGTGARAGLCRHAARDDAGGDRARALRGGRCLPVSLGTDRARRADHPAVGAGWRTRRDAEAVPRSGAARPHRRRVRGGDADAVRRRDRRRDPAAGDRTAADRRDA